MLPDYNNQSYLQQAVMYLLYFRHIGMPAAQLHYCLLQIRLIVVIWQHLLLTWLEEMLLSEIQQVAHRPLADVTCQIWGGVCVFAVDFHKNSFLQLKQKD